MYRPTGACVMTRIELPMKVRAVVNKTHLNTPFCVLGPCLQTAGLAKPRVGSVADGGFSPAPVVVHYVISAVDPHRIQPHATDMKLNCGFLCLIMVGSEGEEKTKA
jgi:hypothetical protein